MHFPQWVDLKGQDSVPDTVHHVVVPIDPKTDRRWMRLKQHVKVLVLFLYCFHFKLNPLNIFFSVRFVTASIRFKVDNGLYIEGDSRALLFCPPKQFNALQSVIDGRDSRERRPPTGQRCAGDPFGGGQDSQRRVRSTSHSRTQNGSLSDILSNQGRL